MEVVTRCMPPDMHCSASATRPGVLRERALLVTNGGLSSSASLSFTGQEREGTGLLKTPAPQEPACRNIHVARPSSPSTPRQIPQAYNPNPNTISLHLPSTLKTHMKKTKHCFPKYGRHVQFSTCF